MRLKATWREILVLSGAFLLIFSAVFAQAQSSQGSLIRVEVAGLHNDKGKVVCALFSSPVDFPKRVDKAVAHTSSEIAQAHAFCEFPGIASGTYAVSVFHDENSNGKMDTNLMGIPREGVGASNACAFACTLCSLPLQPLPVLRESSFQPAMPLEVGRRFSISSPSLEPTSSSSHRSRAVRLEDEPALGLL